MASENRRLRLQVSPFATGGGLIRIAVVGENAPDAYLKLLVPDTVLVDDASDRFVGSGNFTAVFDVGVLHVQHGATAMVQVEVTAGPLLQVALCKVSNRGTRNSESDGPTAQRRF